MKRYSTLLILAGWLVFLFVISTITLHIDSAEAKKLAQNSARTVPDTAPRVLQ